ncbi:unnamed protein product [Chironomus riparius]|uniref:Gamma-tubulin complex component 6 n=1 Tax=Chironomus riparius TaxID=315576 RepID=A0A9N9WSQ0_9DIPT|nr:unnamed protein product [Chironomus riparius]
MSVYQLINKLCIELIKESECDEIKLQTARKIAFEVLLKKSFNQSLLLEKTIEDYQFTGFELTLHNRKKELDKLDCYIDVLKENPSSLLPISAFLILLKNIDSEEVCEHHSFLQLQTKAFQDVRKNKYLSHISLSTDHTNNARNRSSSEQTTFLSSILDSYIGHNNSDNLKLKRIEPFQPVISSNTISELSDNQQKSAVSYKKRHTWENLQNHEESSVKSFITESTSLYTFQRLKLASNASSSEITTVSFPKLMNDIKLLILGIESETFKRTETSLKFYMTTRVCCGDISDMNDLLEKFLEVGTCFTRLKSYTAKNPFNQSQIFEGFIFKAFCDRVIKFLNYCRDIIYPQEAETFLDLYNNTSKIMKIIIHLSIFLNIHPSSSTIQRAILSGSDFLRLLYNEYTISLNTDVKCFYVDLLKACCEVYYIRYQEWLYHGKLDDPYKELFIYFVDRYKENTKHFFDRAYLIRKQSVPEFLTGCADNVLLCGKYTFLLKSFNPLHPLFIIRKPPFKICLTHDQINELKDRCREFSRKVRRECGEVISISELLEEKHRIQVEKYKNAEIASTKNALKWKQNQEERLQEIRDFREAQQKELRKELELIEQKKMLKRMTEIQAERDYLDELDRIEDEELQRENEELKARIKIYQELNDKLSDEIDQNKNVTDQATTRKLNPIKIETEDTLNANNPVDKATQEMTIVKDEMNNIVESACELTEAQRNRNKVMSHEYNLIDPKQVDDNNGNNESPKNLTDAQKNRNKVLGYELDLIKNEEQSEQPKINVQDYDKMTDLQKNRLKVMSHEFGLDDKHGYKKDTKENSQRNKVQRDNLTELQRNRQKVMSHEFGFEGYEEVRNPQEKKEKLSLELLNPDTSKLNLESPMSTTSDHFNSDQNESLEKSTLSDLVHNSENKQDDDDADKMEMFRAFEEAIEAIEQKTTEQNQNKFMGIKLNDSSVSAHMSTSTEITKMDTIALSQYLQMSLTLPLNAYMEILNNETLKMYIKDLDILSHFKSLRNYFLLMNGEFCSCISHDMFSKIENGMKPAELLNYQSLHMILDHALSNSRYYDPNTEYLSFIVQNIPEKFEMNSPSILNMLTLSYQLEWPLSLILNPETMDKYRAIFNYLIKLKRITWILEQCFQILKEAHKSHGMEILKSQQYRDVQYIRHKMTQFVNCLENYVTHNVIQISWNAFMEDIKSAESILCIYKKHANYLKRILFLCLLNKSYTEFYKNIEDIFKVILKFYKHLKSGNWLNTSSTYTHEKYNRIQVDADEFHRLIRYILYLGNKVIQQGYQKEIYDLLHLINVNDYYSNDD